MITFTAWAIWILLAVAGLHYIYEGIILPVIRLHFRYRLFAIRDQVRRLQDDRISDQLYQYMQENVNNAIALLPRITFSFIKDSENYLKENPNLSNRIERRAQAFVECEAEVVRDIHYNTYKIVLLALGANCLGLIAYILPIFFIGIAIAKIKETVKRIISVPENETVIYDNLGCPA